MKGQEIYEGDIVHSNTRGASGYYVFFEGSFFIKGIPTDDGVGHWHMLNDAVVIGNVFANPELLKR